MTGITPFGLRRDPLNIMRGGKFPCGQRIKILHGTFNVIVKQIGIGWYMPQNHILVWSLLCGIGILTDVKIHLRTIYLIIGQALAIFTYMAAVAIFVRYRMADMAFQFSDMGSMNLGFWFF